MAIRVEAASYRDRLVYFRIAHPDWGETPRDRPIPILNFGPGYLTLVDTINGLITAALLFFAVRNIRRGRADLRGALTLAAIIFVGQLLFWLLAGGHFSRLGLAFPLFVSETASILFACGLVATSYVALEPVIRRRCPHRLTAWTRLASGRWRDPLVGRDILLGMLVGVATTVDCFSMPFFPSRWGPTVVHPYSFLHPLGQLVGDATIAVGATWLYAGVFAVLLVVARREWIAMVVLAAIFLLFALGGSGFPLLNQVFQMVRIAAVLYLLLRLGMLAVVACYFAGLVLQAAPLSLDRSAWYFGSSLTYLAALTALAGYAAWISLGGRPLLNEGAAGLD
jgi:serine/threonine-protein kinase